MSKVWDCFMLFNELDLLEIRLNHLTPFVDKFVLVESPQTFSGIVKPLYFQENKDRFKKFLDKIITIKVPAVDFSDPWGREEFQRNMISEGLKDCKPDDIIMIGDLDEIPRKGAVDSFRAGKRQCTVFNQSMYICYINGLWDRRWLGTVICYYSFLFGGIKPHALRLSRRHYGYISDAGWHFSYIGGPAEIVKKVAAYSHQEGNNPEFINVDRIEKRMKDGLEPGKRNRAFVCVPLDDTFPKFILDNKGKYAHLIKDVPPKIISKQCTVVVTSSFVRLCHPCTKMVERSVGSLKRIFGCVEPKLLFSLDFDPDPKYLEYKRRLREKFFGAAFIEADEAVGLYGTLKQALETVTDPIILVWQHDFEMIQDVPFENISKVFISPWVKYLRMGREKTQVDKWNKLVDEWRRPDLFVCATSGWSDNPHFARTEYYKDIIIPMSKPMGGSVGIEGIVWTEFQKLIEKVGFVEANKKFGTFIYGCYGDEPRTRHLVWKRGKKPICVEEGCERGN